MKPINCIHKILLLQLKAELKKTDKLEKVKPKFKTNAKF